LLIVFILKVNENLEADGGDWLQVNPHYWQAVSHNGTDHFEWMKGNCCANLSTIATAGYHA
jgi:hypothetical protein